MKTVTGYSDEELPTMTTSDIVTEESKKLAAARILEVFTKGVANLEANMLTKSGTEIPYYFTGIRTIIGNKTYLVGVGVDITEIKKIEEALLVSQERYNALFDRSLDIVFISDIQGNFIDANPSALTLFGYAREDLPSLNFASFLSGEEQQLKALNAVQEIIETGSQKEATEYRIQRKDGSVIWLETKASLIYKEGKPYAIQGIGRDTTERKKAETAVSRYSDLLKIINRILRHDVINHLGVTISALRLYGKSKEEELLKEASRRANESVDLIRKMKDLETMLALHKELKPIDVRGEIEKIKEQYGSIAYDIKGEATVLADEALDSVIVNIMTNAIIHGKTERIDVHIEEKGEWCEIRIADYGIGIPDEIKEKIFEEGFRYGKTGQSGLGLYIVKMVMERYEGSVHIEDNIPNGAVFVLRLRRVP